MFPLRYLEHEAYSFNPGDVEDALFVMPSSIVVMADHGPGRDVGVPWGRRFCWSGSEVAKDHPKLTWCMSICRNTMPGDVFVAAV